MAQPSNLLVRFGTAVVCCPLILLLLYRGPAWGFFLLVFPAAVVGAWELFSMTHAGDRVAQAIGTLIAALVSIAIYFHTGDLRVVFTVLIVVPLLGPLVTLVRLGAIETAAMRAFAMSFAPLAIAIPMTLLAVIRRDMDAVRPGVGPSYVVMTLMLAWFGDTFGYFFGRFLGKHKLYEAVSPKKTIEGALGGLVAAALFMALAGSRILVGEAPVALAALGLSMAAVGICGDLFESSLKRRAGRKDSSALIAGHGGVLDRIDALLFATPLLYLFLRDLP